MSLASPATEAHPLPLAPFVRCAKRDCKNTLFIYRRNTCRKNILKKILLVDCQCFTSLHRAKTTEKKAIFMPFPDVSGPLPTAIFGVFRRNRTQNNKQWGVDNTHPPPYHSFCAFSRSSRKTGSLCIRANTQAARIRPACTSEAK